jgi:serine phosphatase RsbU (regulator of sigma subunit)
MSAPGPGVGVPGSLLVVDDNEMNRDLLVRRVRRQGYEAKTAENGRQALEMVGAETFDLVLLDIMMPGMDGYEVLERIKADESLQDLRVIMISAVDDIDSIVRCIELGADDYLPKPFNKVLLHARIESSLSRKRLHDSERAMRRGLERDLEIGREIQAGFFPAELPEVEGWQIAAHFQAARRVGGDFYDVFPLDEGEKIGLVIADVCDKGVGAALFMALIRSLLRATAQRLAESAVSDPVSALERSVILTNDYIAETHSRENMFATLFFAVLDPASGHLDYINGGHEAPAIVGPSGVRARLPLTGPAVGALPGMSFRVETAQVEAGETLVAFTDGVTEARGPGGEFYTEERLLDLLEQPAPSAEELLHRIVVSVPEHARGVEQSDDITLLAVRREEST